MKKLKKIFALLITMSMVLGMSAGVFAAGGDTQGRTGTITVNNASDTVGKYVEDTDGTAETQFKYDATTNTYVQLEDGETYNEKNTNTRRSITATQPIVFSRHLPLATEMTRPSRHLPGAARASIRSAIRRQKRR